MTVRTDEAVPAGARVANVGSRPDTSGDRGREAPQGGIPYDPPSCIGRSKNDIPCRAHRANDTLYCVGHLRQRGEL